MFDLKEHPHTRLNLLTGEWILVSPHRMKSPWQGKVEELPKDNRPTYDAACYLCPTKKRIDVTLFADDKQVEEKDGNIFIYYRKSNINDTAYMAGRFNSKDKYAPTYGFLECRMHIVIPNGHQMTFWMMPEGEGMKGKHHKLLMGQQMMVQKLILLKV